MALATTSSPRSIAAQFLGLFTNPLSSQPPLAWPRSPSPWAASPTWMPTFLHRFAGLSVANASLAMGAITVVDGIAGTLIGGWLAQRWLRTNDRALYLLSFWSVALTLPCGVLVFFGPPAWAVPGSSLPSSSFPQHRPAQCRHRQLRLRAGPRHRNFDQPVLHSRLRRHVFSHIIGAISDRVQPPLGLGATLIFLILSGTILRRARALPRRWSRMRSGKTLSVIQTWVAQKEHKVGDQNSSASHQTRPSVNKLILAFTLLSLPLLAQAQQPATAQPPDPIRSTLQPLIDNHTIAGAVTLVATRDRIIYLQPAGYRDLAEKAAMPADAMFWIASTSKPMTVTAFMMLVDEGKVSVDDPVEKYCRVSRPDGQSA